MYIDYSNVYSGARDAFMLEQAQGHRGNITPAHLAKCVALRDPGSRSARRETHELILTRVFRGAPDPQRDPRGALMEAKRAHRWEQMGCKVHRHTIDYGQGKPVEKGVDVRLATELLMDAVQETVDLQIVVSADKDFRHLLLKVRDLGKVDIEVASWVAIPGGRGVGRIQLRPERPDEPEVAWHQLDRHDFGKLEDKVDYRTLAPPPTWRGPTGHQTQ